MRGQKGFITSNAEIPSLCYLFPGLLEFGEFCQLAAKFLVEEDEEALKKELKEAFRIYDKEGEQVIQELNSFFLAFIHWSCTFNLKHY
jgi:Ca2+-binding EF-hand superfamily protein